MKQNDSIKKLERSTFQMLKRASQLASNLYSDKTAGQGLTQRQFAIMIAVRENSGITQTSLVKLTGIDRSTTADMVARLTAQGYIRQKRSPSDRRAKTLSISNAGKAALSVAEPAVASVDRKLSSLIPKEHRKSFKAALKILASIPKDE